MVEFSHLCFIDESGNASPTVDIQRLWVSAAIAVPLAEKEQLDIGIDTIRRTNFRRWVKELKGTEIPHGLLAGRTSAQVVKELAALMKSAKAHVWICGTRHGVNTPPGFTSVNPQAKDIARQLLLERVNGFLTHYGSGHFMLLWDISNVNELRDFSQSVRTFINTYSGGPRSPLLSPAILGALSHEWSGLQAADLFAHYALHAVASKRGLPGANAQKAVDFDKFLRPCLQADAKGNTIGVGWKIW